MADHWQRQYEHAQERYKAQFELNAELIAGLKRAQAEAWEEGVALSHGYNVGDEEFKDLTSAEPFINPYREA